MWPRQTMFNAWRGQALCPCALRVQAHTGAVLRVAAYRRMRGILRDAPGSSRPARPMHIAAACAQHLLVCAPPRCACIRAPSAPCAHIRRELSAHYACPMAAPWCDFMAARGHRHGHMVHARLAPMRAASIQQKRPAQHARAQPRAYRDNVAEYVMGMLHRCCAT